MTFLGHTKHLILGNLFNVARLLEVSPFPRAAIVAVDFATDIESCLIRKCQVFTRLMGNG